MYFTMKPGTNINLANLKNVMWKIKGDWRHFLTFINSLLMVSSILELLMLHYSIQVNVLRFEIEAVKNVCCF